MPDEKIYFQTKKHFIIFLMPVAWSMITVFFLSQNKPLIPGIHLPFPNNMAVLAWVPGIMAVFSWLNQGLNYLTSHFIVTNRRIIMREGFFYRHATETRLAAVAEIKINQSLLGQILNFGTVIINSFGGGAEIFDLISSPIQFQMKVSEQMK